MMSECSEGTGEISSYIEGRLRGVKNFISERENLILIALLYSKPVERFENRGGVSKSWSFDDSTSKRILNLLEPV